MQDTEQVDLDRRSAGAVATMSFSTRRIVLVLTFTTVVPGRVWLVHTRSTNCRQA
jgi:hypothetical protein